MKIAKNYRLDEQLTKDMEIVADQQNRADLELLTIKLRQMTIESTNLQNTTEPAITYSECYAHPYLLFNESNLDTMKRMTDNFIDLTVTSPPYDNLRDYNDYSFPFEDIAKELYRVTKQGGMVIWIIGDETKNFCESMTSFAQAMYFHFLGFNLLDTMIYYKQNYAPAYPTLRRYANQFEYMFVFSKGKPKTFNPIQKEKVRNKEEKVAYRQKDGTLRRKLKEKGRETKDASNVWEFAVGGNLTGHPAVFPEQLANDHIISWSNENDLVYDPFAGSGTTGKMAILNKRKCIMSEISAEYCEIIKKRLEPIINERTLF